jgi:hypothetical protein
VNGYLSENDRNLESLKMKLQYVTKRQVNFGKRLSRSIAEDSKVFHHDFDIIRKIDEQMLKNRNSKVYNKITFPQLMSQIRRQEKAKWQSAHESNE